MYTWNTLEYTLLSLTMARSTRTQCVWIVTLILMVGSCSVALKCEDKCDGCSTTSIVCYGGKIEMSEIVSVLPPYTQEFSFVADSDVYLGDSNFGNLTELKILNITALNDSEVNLYIYSSEQNVFSPLAKLQTLAIHLAWYFFEPVDALFRPLMCLEELDLSQTRFLSITNLHRAMYGLSNSTTLKTIKLSNIQAKGHVTFATLNMTWFLEPLQSCPIRYLHLAHNSLQAIYAGIIRYAPLLKYIDVSYNQLVNPGYYYFIWPSGFLFEILLHKGLQEVDYSYQGYPIKEQTHGLLGSKPRFPDEEEFTHKKDELKHWYAAAETFIICTG